MNLPAKSRILQKATVFNQSTRDRLFNKLIEDKRYVENILNKDYKKDILFRNYEDYLYSIILEKENKLKRFKSISFEDIFNSKNLLKIYQNDLENVKNEEKIKNIVVFDTETTDIYGYIVSYAMVVYDFEKKEIVDEIYELVNPVAKISDEAFNVHKISENMIKDKPTFLDIHERFLSVLNNADMIVGHNIFYDLGVLKRELERINYHTNRLQQPIFDTMYFSVDVVELGKKKMPRLEECVAYFFGSQNANYHNALEDVKMTLKVFEKLMEIK